MTQTVSRLLVLDDYQGVALDLADWSAVPGAPVLDVSREHVGDETRLVELLAPYDVVVAMRERTPFPRRVLERLPSLRLLVTTGMRNASIDLDAARELGIEVRGTQGSSNGPVEQTWALVLGLARQVAAEDASLRAGGWQHTVGVDLAGRVLGVAGLGRLGSAVARIGRAFGMEVVAWSPHLTPERAAEHGVEAVSFEDLLRRADVLSLHLVLGETTRGLIGAAELAQLKRDALLVNTSRGPLVDEAALLDALRAGTIGGAALDVFETEPLPRDHPLRSAPRTLLSPHVGYVTRSTYAVFYSHAVEDVVAYCEGRALRVLT